MSPLPLSASPYASTVIGWTHTHAYIKAAKNSSASISNLFPTTIMNPLPIDNLMLNPQQQLDMDKWCKKLVGKIILKDNEETTLGADEVVREKDLPKPNRVLLPNSPMTMDYRPNRLNVFLDENRRVVNLNNG
ncbi:predicted protein [Lichtheimia corymbifera JMRC:FSU:9682]|uniref:Uncharacterized protein n=1 Tax=Lichtheimia corymbifera JMRC:FSU:9682 TaxID=1263082 RepID=A0A068S7D1_9FUNG|nr:predicted protein [Lichtheimia corymbifera JMRC:FSU:9682]